MIDLNNIKTIRDITNLMCVDLYGLDDLQEITAAANKVFKPYGLKLVFNDIRASGLNDTAALIYLYNGKLGPAGSDFIRVNYSDLNGCWLTLLGALIGLLDHFPEVLADLWACTASNNKGGIYNND